MAQRQAWQERLINNRRAARVLSKQQEACAHPEEHRKRKPLTPRKVRVVCERCFAFWTEGE